MHDAEPLIMAELNRLAPGTDTGRPDWTNVLARATADRRSRRISPLVAIAVVAIAVPTVAFSSGVRGLLGLGPTPVLDSAKLLVSAPAGNGFFAHAWQGPSTTGGSCLFLTQDHTAKLTHPPLWNGGGVCTMHGGARVVATSASLPLTPGVSIGRRPKHGEPRNWVPPVVFGSVYAKLHATRIVIEWKGGSHQLVLRDGWFLGGTPALYMPSFAKFPFTVVAYDAAGKAVARKKLESPSLLLLSGGWNEYAGKYHAWQKHRR